MSWRTTPSGRYYYRWRKEQGRSRAEYFGSGKAADRAAAEDHQRLLARQADALQRAGLKSSLAIVQQRLDEFRIYVKGLIAVVQWQRGYFLRKREWRRRRVSRKKT